MAGLHLSWPRQGAMDASDLLSVPVEWVQLRLQLPLASLLPGARHLVHAEDGIVHPCTWLRDIYGILCSIATPCPRHSNRLEFG